MRKCTWAFSGLAAALVLAVVLFCERTLAFRACGGEYVYPIDDTYIHMAMAKMLATDGIWGVESGKLAFCSSSPLWTLLLGGLFFVFGVVDSLPWSLAFAFNVASLFVVCRLVSRLGGSAFVQFLGGMAVAVAGPFLCTTALGMEHAMHAFFLIASLVFATEFVDGFARRPFIALMGCAACATASRYESLFLLGPITLAICFLEVCRRWRRKEGLLPVKSLCVGFAAVLPVFAYGLWALSQGGHFLPNSLLLKGKFLSVPDFLHQLCVLLGSVRPNCGFLYLLAVALIAAGFLRRTPLFWRLMAGATLVAIGAQLLFADVGQLCRYEAYLTSFGALVIVAAVVAAGGFGRLPLAYLPMGVFLLTGWVFLQRAQGSFGDAVRSSSDIRHQQVLMTRMLSAMPEADRGCVALNDLGYMSMYGNFPIVDFWGLGSQDAAELLLKHPGVWKKGDYEKLIRDHGVRYIAVFEKWYPFALMPDTVIDVAKLTLKDNFACGADTVIFRATGKDAADRLERHLAGFVDRMPPRATLKIVRSHLFD